MIGRKATMKIKSAIASIILGLAAVVGGVTPAQAADARLINGAGATFPYPIYSKWFDEFGKKHPDYHFNYQSVGSGAGIRQVSEMTVDFGATDGPMNDDQLKASKQTLLHFPTVLGAVVPSYNIPGVNAEINFTGTALAKIFMGQITKWNDPELVKANPGIPLPDKAIVVVHRSDGSGTTYIWTDFLSKASPEWSQKVGKGTSVNWPVGLGGKGNEGVSGFVKQTPYAIGYLELIYAVQNKEPYGKVQNSAGSFVKATLESVSAAAAGAVKSMPEDFRVSITNPPGQAVYPVASFTWLLIPQEIKDHNKGNAIVEFLNWMVSDGQDFAGALSYARLPKEVIEKEKAAITKIKY